MELSIKYGISFFNVKTSTDRWFPLPDMPLDTATDYTMAMGILK